MNIIVYSQSKYIFAYNRAEAKNTSNSLQLSDVGIAENLSAVPTPAHE